jgi:hypothetical protein
MILYKYAHKYGLDILKNLELKASRLDQFNDPFEFLPATARTIPLRTVKKLAKRKDTRRRMYQEIQAKGYLGSFKEYRAQYREIMAGIVRGAASNPELPQKIRDNLWGYIYHKAGVLSLSAVPDSTLMWSHYADFHRGIVVGLTFAKRPLDGLQSW